MFLPKLSITFQEEQNPCRDWLSSKSWNEILSLKVLPNFVDFVDTFANYRNAYKNIFEAHEPHRFFNTFIILRQTLHSS